jgi:hypothetical protein
MPLVRNTLRIMHEPAMHSPTPPKTLAAELIADGDVIEADGHRYLVRIHPAEPDPKWGPQVKVTVEALADDGGPHLGLCESVTTDDEPTTIHDEVDDLIFDLAAYWRDKAEREEREQAVHPFTGEPYS